MNAERIGPFVVLDSDDDIPIRYRRVLVRCALCGRESIVNGKSLEDKRVLAQQRCAKCRNYVTKTTWTKGVKHGQRD